ncbi:MAG: Calx-beta domain-containing protein [Pseudomonadota bacterium]
MKKPRLIHCWLGILCLVMLGACSGGGGGSGFSSPGTIQIESTLYDTREGAIVNIRVARSGGSRGDVSVDFITMDGSAVGGTDYTAANGTLTWPNGVTGNRTVSISIPDDSAAEFAKSFVLKLSNASGGATRDEYRTPTK